MCGKYETYLKTTYDVRSLNEKSIAVSSKSLQVITLTKIFSLLFMSIITITKLCYKNHISVKDFLKTFLMFFGSGEKLGFG